MAFTDTQKFRIVTLLGWPASTIIVGSSNYSNIISDRLTGNPEAVETLTIEKLDRLILLDEKREGALCRASTKEVDDIVLNNDELYILDKERKRILQELSGLIDIPMTGSAVGGSNINVCM